MGFDKDYPNRKDRRKPYKDSRAFDASCRNHKSCKYCENNRTVSNRKVKEQAKDELKDIKD